jgi:hypothetical protein
MIDSMLILWPKHYLSRPQSNDGKEKRAAVAQACRRAVAARFIVNQSKLWLSYLAENL